MEAHQNQVGNSQTSHHPLDAKKEHPSSDPSKPMAAAVDRTKRDEWSEGAVTSLLDAYEAKWVLRNRAKLKGQDWEDVAQAVSARAGSGKSSKTATQCKNKVESMKKRYRSESATGNGSRWPLYARLDGLVRCREPVTVVTVVERSDHEEQQPVPRPVAIAHGTVVAVPELPKPNGEVAVALLPFQVESKEQTSKKHNTNETNHDTAGSTPRSSDESSSEEKRPIERNRKKARRRSDGYMVMKSIQLFAEVALQVEKARIDAMREIETMRAQAEAKRSELDLKRTEIIANTQLKIAKLFARKYADGADSSSSGS
ncbi:Sequence-specific DNA binding transcription factor [Rhynchospora pubera]|uniref:Sequence-specific DNA binding transcription factor n=1 Tax=Rhynchospora pubera TaxID=906938 RepID=A0AAV8GKM2_9POAL|nr:Sequence-specific DNA binding transcription factor [Rhynchospora pubera]KAJ4804819.1 Sequence-specific DNA binding transcription factor [Rhynchospora pubera]